LSNATYSSGNARSAYIQIDDLCELILKSFLQVKKNNWSPVVRTGNGREYFKGFKDVSKEVRQLLTNNKTVNDLLTSIEERLTG
jgi:hypothetical protein